MPESPNNKYLQRFKFAAYLIIAALIPFALRLGHYFLNKKEIPYFYMNEWDLFVFCIAIAVAIMAENKSTKTSDYSQIIHIIFLLLIPTLGLFESISCEHQKILSDNTLISQIHNKNFDIDTFKNNLISIESKKETLFHWSIILSILFIIDCFVITVFKKKKTK